MKLFLTMTMLISSLSSFGQTACSSQVKPSFCPLTHRSEQVMDAVGKQDRCYKRGDKKGVKRRCASKSGCHSVLKHLKK